MFLVSGGGTGMWDNLHAPHSEEQPHFQHDFPMPHKHSLGATAFTVGYLTSEMNPTSHINTKDVLPGSPLH